MAKKEASLTTGYCDKAQTTAAVFSKGKSDQI